ncbi:glycosyltransferase family 2 protein [Microbacterium oleivorans]|uniref:Glycosyltransferase n=1 Tax=Microbacterium oleivorans TaxID=273677 RepID=A0A7D5ESZ9_9MICO|nr:glycosyltransferase [Microbacterium oleivorans]QLD12425.1 glycosyltransferase [Microbacterium oleivorans]
MSEVAVVTLCSAPRLAHLRNQLRATAGLPRVVVWIGDDDAPDLDAETIVRVRPGAAGLRLAAARNAGARAAEALGARLLVFLDADCIPGPELIERYRTAAVAHPDAVLCGPVTYLPAGAALDPDSLRAATSPHPARPAPASGVVQPAARADYPLFWSLSFATTPDVWRAVGGFDEAYEGYGGEDTDFAFSLRERAVPMMWVGGADAYHQHHETSSPPWQHLDDILRNGALFAARWGEWPMTGWLEAFAEAGAVERDGAGWRRAD